MPFSFGFIAVAIVILYLLSSIKILAEYERGVIFRLGQLLPEAKGPGLIFVFAPIDRIVRVSLRQEAMEVPPQDIITRDNVTLKVNAVIFLRVIDPRRAVNEVSNYLYQTSQFAQTTLRSVLGEVELDELLAHRDKINLRLADYPRPAHRSLGRKSHHVEVKQVDMPETMLRAMAQQAEAEREKRAKIIHAEGEFAASQRLSRCRSSARNRADDHPAPLSPDPDGDRCREEHHDCLPASARFAGSFPRHGRETYQTGGW